MTPPRVAAIDFDGVLNDWQNSPTHNGWGPPIDGALPAMRRLRGLKLRIVVFTTKAANPSGKAAVEGWLRENYMPYDEVTATKPAALFYLDDRAIRFTDWPTAFPAIQRVLRENR